MEEVDERQQHSASTPPLNRVFISQPIFYSKFLLQILPWCGGEIDRYFHVWVWYKSWEDSETLIGDVRWSGQEPGARCQVRCLEGWDWWLTIIISDLSSLQSPVCLLSSAEYTQSARVIWHQVSPHNSRGYFQMNEKHQSKGWCVAIHHVVGAPWQSWQIPFLLVLSGWVWGCDGVMHNNTNIYSV